MTEEMNDVLVIEPEAPDPSEIKAEKKSIRRTFSRCGWGAFALTASGYVLALIVTFIVVLIDPSQTGAVPFYNKNILLFNEAFIAFATLCGAIVLIKMPKKRPERTRMSAGSVLAIICICFGVGSIGNIIGNVFLSFWNGLTGQEVTNELAEILASIDPIQMILCTAILAPILEELFFRKLLIDRMLPHGELFAILVSAILFGLFHKNFSQFFYAFALGAVFGYVYCRTGSYLLVTLLHAVFNFVSGVLSALLAPKILAFAEAAEGLTETEMVEMLPSLMSEYGVPLLLYAIYLLILGALNVTGIVLLITNFKKIRIAPHTSSLTKKEQVKAIALNSGMIVVSVTLTVFMIISLFPQ